MKQVEAMRLCDVGNAALLFIELDEFIHHWPLIVPSWSCRRLLSSFSSWPSEEWPLLSSLLGLLSYSIHLSIDWLLSLPRFNTIHLRLRTAEANNSYYYITKPIVIKAKIRLLFLLLLSIRQEVTSNSSNYFFSFVSFYYYFYNKNFN